MITKLKASQNERVLVNSYHTTNPVPEKSYHFTDPVIEKSYFTAALGSVKKK